jgi:hypothetical protein
MYNFFLNQLIICFGDILQLIMTSLVKSSLWIYTSAFMSYFFFVLVCALLYPSFDQGGDTGWGGCESRSFTS